jgi:hypothetical protein
MNLNKDDQNSSGNAKHSNFSLSSITDDVFAHRANMMGVPLGGSPSQIRESIMKIKEANNKRSLIPIQFFLRRS